MANIVIDDEDAGCVLNGPAVLTSFGGYDNTIAASNNSGANAVYTFTGLTPSVALQPSMTWVPFSGVASNVTVTIHDVTGNTTLATITGINEQVAPNADQTLTGSTGSARPFQNLGSPVTPTGTSITVTVSWDGVGNNLIIDAFCLASSTNTPATSYTVSGLPSNTKVGVPYRLTASLVGGIVSTPIVITATPNHGGTMDGTCTISGSNTTGSFVYTPAASGSETLVYTHTGGNGGMTNQSNQSTTVAAVNRVYLTNALAYHSQQGWYSPDGNTIAGIHPGNYAKCCFTGTTATLEVDVTNLHVAQPSAWPSLRILADGDSQAYQVVTLTDPGVNKLYVPITLNSALNGTFHTLRVTIDQRGSGDGWTPRTNGFPDAATVVLSLILDGGATLVTMAGTELAVRPNNAIFYSDSILQGFGCALLSSATWGRSMADALNAEYSMYGVFHQGWTVGGDANIPAVGSAWNFYWNGLSNCNGSGVYLGTPPTDLVICEGRNDTVIFDISSAIDPVLAAMRVAAPSAKMAVMMPFAYGPSVATSAFVTTYGYLKTAFQAYTAGDANAFYIDLSDRGAPYGTNATSTATYCTGDGTHFTDQRNLELGSFAAGELLRQIGGGGGSTVVQRHSVKTSRGR